MFAFSADLHLQPCAWTKHPELRGDAYFALKQLVDFCINNSMPLLLAGDIFDSDRPDAETVAVAAAQLRRMGNACLDVYFIQGNHDYSKPAWLAMTDAHHMYAYDASGERAYCMEIGDYTVTGLDWRPRHLLPAAIQALPPADFLLCHQVWQEFTGFNPEGSLADVHNFPYILSGDYHVHKAVNVRSQDGMTTVLSPGSTCMQSIDEAEQKAFYVIGERDQSGNPTITSHSLLTRRVLRANLTTAAELSRFVGDFGEAREALRQLDVPESLTTPIIDLVYDESLEIYGRSAYEVLREACGSAGVFYRPFTTREDTTVSISVEAIPAPAPGESPLLACLLLAAPEGGRVTQDVQRLLESQEPTATMQQIMSEFLSEEVQCN